MATTTRDLKNTTIAIAYVNLPVVKVKHLSTNTVKAFEQFMHGPPFDLAMHGSTLRHPAADVRRRAQVLDDGDVDVGWLNACNRHMMGMPHRDAILLYDYTDGMYNASLRKNGMLRHRMKDSKGNADMFDLGDLLAPAPRFGHPGVFLVLTLLSTHPVTEETAFRETAQRLFVAPLSKGVLLALWEMARACLKNGDDDKGNHRRTAFKTLKRLKFVETCTWENLSRAGKLAVQKEVERDLAEYTSAAYKPLFRFAFQLMDLIDDCEGCESDLFYDMPPPVAARFDRDMLAFHRTSSPPAKFRLFMRYRFYFRMNANFPRVVEAATARLLDVFPKMPPLRAPLTVFRGIYDRKWMRQGHGPITWQGMVSTTLSTETAFNYTGGASCCFMRMHVPPGFRVIPNMGLTSGIDHMEVLLPHLTTVRTRREHSPPVHIMPEVWPRVTTLNPPIVVYDVDVVTEKASAQ